MKNVLAAGALHWLLRLYYSCGAKATNYRRYLIGATPSVNVMEAITVQLPRITVNTYLW